MNSGYMYEVETDIDFFKELKKITVDKMDQLSISTGGSMSNVQSESNTDPRCLITDEKLRKDHISLECGHKFNYVPLFKEVLFQKCSLLPKNISSKIVTTYTKNLPVISASSQVQHPVLSNGSSLSSLSSSNPNVLSVTYNSSYNLETTKLQYNEMKCPYCRTITPYILPFYPYPDVCKVKYVNTPSNLSLPALACEYDKFISAGENTIFTTSETTGCRSNSIYYDKYDVMLCNKHFNKLESGITSTRKTRKKSHSSNTSDTSETQNIIISHHNPATSACSFTLLSGPRKGCQCGKPMWIPSTSTSTPISTIHDTGLPAYCKAHYNKCMQIH
jgi:hypothetical protein